MSDHDSDVSAQTALRKHWAVGETNAVSLTYMPHAYLVHRVWKRIVEKLDAGLHGLHGLQGEKKALKTTHFHHHRWVSAPPALLH